MLFSLSVFRCVCFFYLLFQCSLLTVVPPIGCRLFNQMWRKRKQRHPTKQLPKTEITFNSDYYFLSKDRKSHWNPARCSFINEASSTSYHAVYVEKPYYYNYKRPFLTALSVVQWLIKECSDNNGKIVGNITVYIYIFNKTNTLARGSCCYDRDEGRRDKSHDPTGPRWRRRIIYFLSFVFFF